MKAQGTNNGVRRFAIKQLFFNHADLAVASRLRRRLVSTGFVTAVAICSFHFPVSAGRVQVSSPSKTDVAQCDKSIEETRVVLLSITTETVQDLTLAQSKGIPAAVTNIDIDFLAVHLGTNTSYSAPDASPATGGAMLYMQGKGGTEYPVNFRGTGMSATPGLPASPLPPQLDTSNLGECYTFRVRLKEAYYPPGSKVNCLIKQGYGEHMHDFKFNNIPFP